VVVRKERNRNASKNATAVLLSTQWLLTYAFLPESSNKIGQIALLFPKICGKVVPI